MKQKEELHVVYIITKLECGGAQKVCLSLFNELPKSGVVTKLISGTEGILIDNIKKSEHVILLNQLKREVTLLYLLWNEILCFIHLVKQLKRLKKKYPTLIVHTHSTKAGLLGRWAALGAGIKIRIHTVHGYGFHQHQYKIIWLLLYVVELITSFITTHYICVSSADIRTGITLLPYFKNRHSLIRAAVDWDTFYIPAQKATSFPSDKAIFVFGSISCFKRQKNLIDLFQAFAHVHKQNPHTRLEVIGDGTLRPELEAWIGNHTMNQAIILHGWQQSVVPFMMHWHAFTLSSLWEGLPCAIVEARLLQLPVLCYDTGGIQDIIAHGKNGFLYKQGDWQQLAQGMLSIIQQQNIYTQLQQHKDNLTTFNNKQMIKQHIKLYHMLTSPHTTIANEAPNGF